MVAFFRDARDTLCGVIVDIGSGSIAASITLSNHTEKLPRILYTHRVHMPVKSTDVSSERVRSMRQTLLAVMHDLEKRGLPILYDHKRNLVVQKVLISCTAPWSHTITQVIHFEQETPFTVTEQLIEQIVSHAYSTEEAQMPEKAQILKDEGQHIIEKSIVDISLNGYTIQDPYDKEATEITLAHVRGLVPTSIWATLEDIQKHIGENIHTLIHTSALIMYCVLRDLHPHIKNALLIDISGEATEVALVQNAILLESLSVGYGMHSLIRDLSVLSKTIPEEAQGYLRAYKQGALTTAQEDSLLKAQKHYVRWLKKAIDELTLRYVLPRTIFLVLDQNVEQFFIDAVEEAVRDGSGHAQKTILPLTPKNTRDFVAVIGDSAIDPHLALTARFFHKLHTCGEINN